MSTVQDDVKTTRIHQLAQRGAALAEAAGRDPDTVADFLRHYFRHVDVDDLLERDATELMGLVSHHFRLAGRRTPGEPAVSVSRPEVDVDGWRLAGRTVLVQIVNDDQPFLVDSVTMEIVRRGWAIRELYHPQFHIRRGPDGGLLDVLHGTEVGDHDDVVDESWIHVEIALENAAPGADALAELEVGLRRVLSDVGVVVADWSAMTDQMAAIATELAEAPMPVSPDERQAAIELLSWLADGHFTFLGFREHDLVVDDGARHYEAVPGTALGLLRPEVEVPGHFNANPPTTEVPQLVMVTKDNLRSTVHRPAFLDYIGVRLFDEDGRVRGERRFLGLFAESAYSEPVSRIPVLRAKAAQILRASGWQPESHGGKSMAAVLNSYPRDELFQATATELAPIIEEISRLRERRQVRMFTRRDPYGRYLSCLVYFPRDRYTTAVRLRMEKVLMEALHGASIEYQAQLGESVLARLHFVVRMPAERRLGSYRVSELEERLTRATRSWDDLLQDELAELPGIDEMLAALTADGTTFSVAGVFPEAYKEDFEPRIAIEDLQAMARLSQTRGMVQAMYVPAAGDGSDLRLKVFRTTRMPLSEVMPHLNALGVEVIDERPYEIALPWRASDDADDPADLDDASPRGGGRAYVLDFGLGSSRSWDPADRDRFMAAFAAAYSGSAESDTLNELVLGAGLSWQQVSWLRAISRYQQQIGTPYSQPYIAAALTSNVDISRLLVQLFETKFRPDDDRPTDDRAAAVSELGQRIEQALDDVSSLDHDRILRAFAAVVHGCVRTNAFVPSRQALALKLLPREIPGTPQPRPEFEIFVHSPRVEGVHLRFGAVARGGLRWSDRPEDFRTEVLGLVKAQMVKNAVIVPVGAKGGFFCHQLPDISDRAAWLAEGQTCYRIFISSLLDVTDNLDGTTVVPPSRVVRHDADDPYLVVAADKGTATFSDLANAISLERGFWLGDAFASGGSVGYDHKAMGITARGAWVSVQRHFREMGIDCQSEDFSCVGVGDMSGDVFGNGMLLSRHTRLVAAFDHRHIFLDPDPDPQTSFAERERLFALPRSSWDDYDRSLISEGGGVHPRSAKSIELTPPVRTVLGISDSTTHLTPAELISAILVAPVDLLWNGGIGTYVKASDETDAEVGDKTNDVLRVDGRDLRARCVGEGGNLGFTQRGRIEYAQAGGRINTDAIDNSAGVDTSDHEVNIKILLATLMTDGDLAGSDREPLLASMTDDVAGHVLEHNYDQNLALANASAQAPSMAPVHESWMRELERRGLLDRGIEFLPDDAEMERRISIGEGLSTPELAVVLAWTKIWLDREITDSDLPDDPYLTDRLVQYFPSQLRERGLGAMERHRLHREIITTVAVNRFVDSAGMTAWWRLREDTGARPAEVMRAQLAARSIFTAGRHEMALRRMDNQVDAAIQTRLRLELRTLVERGTRWLLNSHHGRPIDIQATIDGLAGEVASVTEHLSALLKGREAETFAQREEELSALGLDAATARAVAGIPFLQAAPAIVATAQLIERNALEVAERYFSLSAMIGLDQLQQRIAALSRADHWDALARNALRDDLGQVHVQLTRDALDHPSAVAWRDAHPKVEEAIAAIADICSSEPSLARLSVGVRLLRALLDQH